MAHLLLVDDDGEIAEALADLLRDEGQAVRTACNGEEGLQALHAAHLPDVAVLDVDMPVMGGPAMAHQMLLHDAGEVVMVSDIGMPDEDGYSLMRRVRKLPASRGGRVPALALTAYARGEDVTRAHQVGYQGHLAKPADVDALTRAVAKLALTLP